MTARLLYCHCAFARVIPAPAKAAVLARLSAGDVPFEAVPDLCEMSARCDERLQRLAAETPVAIVACYERAVRGLFQRAGAPLPADGVTVLNMRAETPETIAETIDALMQPATSEAVNS